MDLTEYLLSIPSTLYHTFDDIRIEDLQCIECYSLEFPLTGLETELKTKSAFGKRINSLILLLLI